MTTDAPAGPSRWRIVVAVFGALVVTAGLAGTVINLMIRYTAIQELGYRFVGTAALGELIALGLALMTTVGAVLVRAAPRPWRHAAVVAVLPWVVLVWITAPTLQGLIAPERASGGTEFSVLVQNLWYENTDAGPSVDALLDRDADVLVVVEYTPDHARAFAAADVESRYPHRWEEPVAKGPGLAIFSKLPFSEPTILPLTLIGVRTELRVDDHDVTLFAVHPVSPSDLYSLPMWQRDLRELASAVGAAGPATVVAGDLNASAGHRRFRDVQQAGELRDAQDVGGGGFVPTWPVDGFIPPVLRLDHILVGPDIGIVDVSIIGPLGADHRGVEARLQVPRS